MKIGGPSNDRQNSRAKPVAMLTGVDIDKFPRPDTGRWNSYRPEPGNAKVAQVVTVGSSTGPSSNQEPLAQAPYTGLMVAEPIAKLVSMLPRKENYDGALLNVPELIAFLITAPLPLPLVPANNVPLHGGREVIIWLTFRHGNEEWTM